MQSNKQILEFLAKEIYNGNEVAEIFNSPIIYPSELIEELSLLTARLFYNNEIEYIDGDYIMNNLYSYWCCDFFSDYNFGDIAYDCFNAFDAGEYTRSEDDPKTDPAEKYTRNDIKQLLSKIDNQAM